jgi:hypothetical protein
MKHVDNYISFGIIRMDVEIEGENYRFMRHLEDLPSFMVHKRSMKWFWGNEGVVTDEMNDKLNKLYQEYKK